MQVLGWTERVEDAPAVMRVGRLSMHLSTAPFAAPREVMATQCALARKYDAFLPASAGITHDQTQLTSWTAKNENTILDRLAAVRDAAQVSVQVTQTTRPLAVCTGSWLRRRAAQHQQASAAEAAIRGAMARLSPLESFVKPLRNAFSLSFLIPRHRLEDVYASLNTAGQRDLAGWSCAVIAPLPVYHFSDIGLEGQLSRT
ncbi:MAG: GvpL/GvpF family gas vesicle protein [Pseudomonadota bacterium]